MEKNVSLETIQTKHSSRYAMNAIKKHITRKNQGLLQAIRIAFCISWNVLSSSGSLLPSFVLVNVNSYIVP